MLSVLFLLFLTYLFSFLAAGAQEVSFRDPFLLLLKRRYHKRAKYFNEPTLLNVQVIDAFSKPQVEFVHKSNLIWTPWEERQQFYHEITFHLI